MILLFSSNDLTAIRLVFNLLRDVAYKSNVTIFLKNPASFAFNPQSNLTWLQYISKYAFFVEYILIKLNIKVNINNIITCKK